MAGRQRTRSPNVTGQQPVTPAFLLSRRLRRHRRRRHSRIARSALATASWTIVALAAMACLVGLIWPDVH
ncbi:MAG TPA: hypothetical protein VKF14_14370 [Candidatus Dormibacteraeota bacterium]|nr:hypothetical protein [Candidatus Dormibacteraeota bacterium]